MKKVITYGTYDCLHYGHIRLLERAKALGDFLIVGVTSEDFDVSRGKINVKQSLAERVEAVRKTGIADLIIVEEYQGQKIDDIQRYGIDIFTVGSDWKGNFDYLNEYCQVVYLPRTEGVSSTDLRSEEQKLTMGIMGEPNSVIEKFINEGEYVNGLVIKGICTDQDNKLTGTLATLELKTSDYDRLLNTVESVYIETRPETHYRLIKEALEKGKHVICESPMLLTEEQCNELYTLAERHNVVLMEAIKTAYSLAFNRMIVLIKSGIIGDIVSVDATCTSLAAGLSEDTNGSLYGWSPQALLAIFKILGNKYLNKQIQTILLKNDGQESIRKVDIFTKIDFVYEHSVASLKVGKGVKSEGDLIVSGTRGYIYVPAPWWKMDYFEARYEDPNENKRFFYQLKGEGIRNMIVQFVKSVSKHDEDSRVSKEISMSIAKIMNDFNKGIDVVRIGETD